MSASQYYATPKRDQKTTLSPLGKTPSCGLVRQLRLHAAVSIAGQRNLDVAQRHIARARGDGRSQLLLQLGDAPAQRGDRRGLLLDRVGSVAMTAWRQSEHRRSAILLGTAALRVLAAVLGDAAAALYNLAFDAANCQRMLKEGVENELIPIDSWALFAEQGGLSRWSWTRWWARSAPCLWVRARFGRGCDFLTIITTSVGIGT